MIRFLPYHHASSAPTTSRGSRKGLNIRLVILVSIPIFQISLWRNGFSIHARSLSSDFEVQSTPSRTSTNNRGTKTSLISNQQYDYPFIPNDSIRASSSSTVLAEEIGQQYDQKLSSSLSNVMCNVTLELGQLQFTSFPSRYRLSDFLEGPGLSFISDDIEIAEVGDVATDGKFSRFQKLLDEKQRMEEKAKQKGSKQNDILQSSNHNSSQRLDDNNVIETSDEEAVCLIIKSRINPSHFPHTMQQLYRCWSWWQVNHPHKVPVLEFSNEIHHKSDIAHSNQFNYGFFKMLKKYANVTIRRQQPQQQQVEDWNIEEMKLNRTQRNLFVSPKKSFEQNDYPYQSNSPSHLHALRDIFINHLNQPLDEQRSLNRGSSPTAINAAATTTNTITLTRLRREKRRPTITILNRNKTRQILNDQDIVAELSQRVYEHYHSPLHKNPTLTTINESNNIQIEYFDETKSFEEQIQILYSTDILISPHGAALTGIPFLPNCASVVEIFPLGMHLDTFFGTLSAISNVEHSYVYLTRDAHSNQQRQMEVQYGMSTGESRQACRGANLCLPVQEMADVIMTIVKRWERRCALQVANI